MPKKACMSNKKDPENRSKKGCVCGGHGAKKKRKRWKRDKTIRDIRVLDKEADLCVCGHPRNRHSKGDGFCALCYCGSFRYPAIEKSEKFIRNNDFEEEIKAAMDIYEDSKDAWIQPIILDKEGSEKVLDLIENPPKPTKALKELFKKK